MRIWRGINPIVTVFTNQDSFTVVHGLGYKPFVEVRDSNRKPISCRIQHNTGNTEYVVTFATGANLSGETSHR